MPGRTSLTSPNHKSGTELHHGLLSQTTRRCCKVRRWFLLRRVDRRVDFGGHRKELHAAAHLPRKFATNTLEAESNPLHLAFARHVSQDAVHLQHRCLCCSPDRHESDMEYRETACWPGGREHRQMLGADRCRTQCARLMHECTRCDAVGVEPNEFTHDPDTRLERQSIGRMVQQSIRRTPEVE